MFRNVAAQRPLAYWRFQGWRVWQYQFDDLGFFAQAYMVFDADGTPITTRAWEAFRDGVEDLQLIRMLEAFYTAEHAKAPSASAVTRVRQVLDEAQREVLAPGYMTRPEEELAGMLLKHRVRLLETAAGLKK